MKGEIIGGWRKLHDDELNKLHALLDVIRMFKAGMMKWARYVACLGEKRNPYRILVRKTE